MIDFRVLGSLELRESSGEGLRSVVAQPKRLALLSYLVVASPRGFQRRDALLGVFWPELDETHARGALSQAVYYLRRSLGRDVVLSRGHEEIGIDRRRLWCDAVAFEELLDAGSLRDALDLYRGDLLPGLFLSDALEWERWLDRERSRLRDRAAAAASTLARQAADEGSPTEAARWGRRAVSLAPADEARLAQLIVLLDGMGDRAGALRVYEEAAKRLARDYETDPSPETRALIEEIRSREEPVAGVGSPPARPRGPDPVRADRGFPMAGMRRRERESGGEGANRGWRRRLHPKRRLLFLGAAAVTAISLIGAALLWQPMQADDASPIASGKATTDSRTLAVLPLADSSPNVEDAYIADGLTEDLISHLSRIRDLRVIAPASVMRYRGRDWNMRRIGQEVGASVLLAGSVRKAGQQVRISVQLLDAENQRELWAEDYEVDIFDLLSVQRDIADGLVTALQMRTAAPERRRLAGGGTESSDAYSEYLKGRYFLGKLDRGSFGEARAHFQRALDLGPTFALAWSGLSNTYIHLTSLYVLPALEAYPRARAAAERALELAPDLAEAHAALAMALSTYYWDTGEAERHFRHAVDLEPSSARSRRLYAAHLRNLGRFEEALNQIREARELDPFFSFSHIEEGIILYMARRYDEALAKFHRFLRVEPANTHVYVFMAMVYAQNGEYRKALAALRESDPENRRPDAQAQRGYVYARMGRDADARQMLASLEELSRDQPVSPFHKAAVYVGLGEHDRALDLLEEAADERTWHVRLLKVEPFFDPLRSEPRFQLLLKRVNLSR